MFTDRFPADMMKLWQRTPEGLYDACALALRVAEQTDRAAYARMFGDPAAVKAATELCALRYGSPGDPVRAVQYGPEANEASHFPMASVVACIIDESLYVSGTYLPRLINRSAIATITELKQIVLATDALFGPATGTRRATLADLATYVEALAAEQTSRAS
jgi:hypothetical protein